MKRVTVARAFAATALLTLAASAKSAATAVDLAGSWHVLVHYRDESTAHPEREHWDDRVWVFERAGSRLRWSEYPIVVFDDDSGRFERRATGQYARVLGFWEPNPSQLEDIREGLRVNDRGSKQKSLRGSDAAGWRSHPRLRAASALVITYSETWSIKDPSTKPVFTRIDTLSGLSEDEAGRTEYRTTDVSEGGNVLAGTFERDGTRRGTFRMRRAGAVAALARDRSQSDLQREAFLRSVRSSPALREAVQDSLRAELAANGVFLSEAELADLSREALELTGEGLEPAKIARRLGDSVRAKYYAFAPRRAQHDDRVRYQLPFDPTVPRRLAQGVGGDTDVRGFHADSVSHKGRQRYAFDFLMPVGTRIVAARDGVVARVTDGFSEGGPQKSLAAKANSVTVLHADGTFAVYVHLSLGIAVEPEQAVRAGDLLGTSGNTGYTERPNLHFSVHRIDEDGRSATLSIHFDDGSADGFVPVVGLAYGGLPQAETSGGRDSGSPAPGARP